jgi:hypothetical protein
MNQENHAKIHYLHRLFIGCQGMERSRSGPTPLSSGQELLCIYDGNTWKGLYLAVLKSPQDKRLKGQWAVIDFVYANGCDSFHPEPLVRLTSSEQAMEAYTDAIEQSLYKRWANERLVTLAIETLVSMKLYTRVKTNRESHGSLTVKDSEFIHLWNDPNDQSRGVGWIMIHSSNITRRNMHCDSDIPIMRKVGDPLRSKIQGKNWMIICRERKIPLKASSGLKESRIASWAQKIWSDLEYIQNPSGRVKSVLTRSAINVSYVYFVRLDTFTEPHSTTGFYKVGKANSVPKRIRQFGNCSVVHLLTCESPVHALRFEQELLTHFSEWRQEGTEILRMPHVVVHEVISKMQELSMDGDNNSPPFLRPVLPSTSCTKFL